MEGYVGKKTRKLPIRPSSMVSRKLGLMLYLKPIKKLSNCYSSSATGLWQWIPCIRSPDTNFSGLRQEAETTVSSGWLHLTEEPAVWASQFAFLWGPSQKSTERVILIPIYPTLFTMAVGAITRHNTWLPRPGNYEWSKNSPILRIPQFCLGKYTYLGKYSLWCSPSSVLRCMWEITWWTRMFKRCLHRNQKGLLYTNWVCFPCSNHWQGSFYSTMKNNRFWKLLRPMK